MLVRFILLHDLLFIFMALLVIPGSELVDILVNSMLKIIKMSADINGQLGWIGTEKEVANKVGIQRVD